MVRVLNEREGLAGCRGFFFLFKKGDTAAMVLIGRNMDWKGAGRLGIMFC